MNKIYNNLNIENLTKTEWFNQFNRNQQKVILKGIENNVNIYLYAKKEFKSQQMEQIRIGLTKNVDVSYYDKPYFKKSK